MTDPRIDTLAKNLIGFSCNVQKGENVMIETYGDCDALLLALIRETYVADANPFVWRRDNEVQRAIAMGATDAQLSLMALLGELAREGRAVAVVLHDLPLALSACDGLLVLRQGRVAAQTAPGDEKTERILADVFGVRVIPAQEPGVYALAGRV